MAQGPTSSPAARVMFASAVLTLIFGFGTGTGFYFYPKVFPQLSSAEDHVEHGTDHAHEDEGEHLDLTKQAAANLQLKLGTLQQGDYWKSILLPAQVVEIPGQSDLAVSAPVTGIVSRVDVLPGQSLMPNLTMFEIQLTDEALTDAQSKLLTTLTSQEVKRQELDRLRPLIESGAVSGTKSRELEYELKQLTAQQAVLTQELLGRGLPKSTIDGIVANRELATALTVLSPAYVQTQPNLPRSTGYSVENLTVHPGMAVERGTLLCNVAYHAELYIKGTAFEADLPILNRVAENGWDISLELPQSELTNEQDLLGSVKLLRVDNHVSEASQTVHFYARVSNRVTREQSEQDRVFEQWMFRPGQRLHLRLPVELWRDQLILPASAVVVDGPNVLVFAQHQEPSLNVSPYQKGAREFPKIEPVVHLSKSTTIAPTMANVEAVDVDLELEPIPVRMLYRDDRTVVLANDGGLRPDMKIALNNAQALYLAMKMKAGGGGHHHDHDH
ncbi:MAG: hypothetical protein U0930_21300 [Pirellulales bacterium]